MEDVKEHVAIRYGASVRSLAHENRETREHESISQRVICVVCTSRCFTSSLCNIHYNIYLHYIFKKTNRNGKER